MILLAKKFTTGAPFSFRLEALLSSIEIMRNLRDQRVLFLSFNIPYTQPSFTKQTNCSPYRKQQEIRLRGNFVTTLVATEK